MAISSDKFRAPKPDTKNWSFFKLKLLALQSNISHNNNIHCIPRSLQNLAPTKDLVRMSARIFSVAQYLTIISLQSTYCYVKNRQMLRCLERRLYGSSTLISSSNRLSALNVLNMADNILSGMIPSSLCKLAALIEI